MQAKWVNPTTLLPQDTTSHFSPLHDTLVIQQEGKKAYQYIWAAQGGRCARLHFPYEDFSTLANPQYLYTAKLLRLQVWECCDTDIMSGYFPMVGGSGKSYQHDNLSIVHNFIWIITILASMTNCQVNNLDN